jgi:hypothetical protein
MSDWPPFYRTQMGQTFFAKHVPDLVRVLGRIADALEKATEQQPKPTEPGDKPEDRPR